MDDGKEIWWKVHIGFDQPLYLPWAWSALINQRSFKAKIFFFLISSATNFFFFTLLAHLLLLHHHHQHHPKNFVSYYSQTLTVSYTFHIKTNWGTKNFSTDFIIYFLSFWIFLHLLQLIIIIWNQHNLHLVQSATRSNLISVGSFRLIIPFKDEMTYMEFLKNKKRNKQVEGQNWQGRKEQLNSWEKWTIASRRWRRIFQSKGTIQAKVFHMKSFIPPV